MRNRLKRAAAAVITAVMLLTLLSASLASGDGEVLSAPVLPGLGDGGVLLNQVQEQSNTDEGTVTVTFAYDSENMISTVNVPSGSSLSEIQPDDPAPLDESSEDLYFLGWRYAEGEECIEDAVITENTTFIAVFYTAYWVACHDMMPDGSEDNEEEDGITIGMDWLIPAGMTLAEAFDAYDLALRDGTPASACVWRDEAETLIDLSAPVSANMDIYTHTYQIVLTLNANDTQAAMTTFSLVDVTTEDDGTLTMTITAREGEKLSAADFVVNGVDYSLYTWIDESGEPVDIQYLITNGVTRNITATSNGTLSDAGIAESADGTIYFYVSINNDWVALTPAGKAMTVYKFTSQNTYALSSAQLMSIYGAYGFPGLDDGTCLVWHTDHGSTTIYGDRAAFEVNGIVYSPILRNGTTCDVYYMPKGAETADTTSGPKSGFASRNTFFTVTVSDPGQKVYTADTLPAVTYTLKGGSATMTVDAPDGVAWQCVGANGNTVTGTANGDGTVTFEISAINQSYVISPVVITYNINLPQEPADAEYGKPQIEGGSTYTVLVNGEHTVLAPSLRSYFYDIAYGDTADRYQGEATFTGWQIEGTEVVLQPGDTLDWTQYGGTSITLLAQWDVKASGANDNVKTGSMVNFFVALNALPEGTTGWVGNTEVSKFTSSVYVTDCRVTGTDAMTNGWYYDVKYGTYSNQYFVLGGTSGTNLNDNHTTIVNNLSKGYDNNGAYGSTYYASFPSDETVLRNIRSMVANNEASIQINGKPISEEDLTTANFTIKWYVFKYDTSDGWHIDGILVAKTGKLVVTKTFAGDDGAINEVMKDYSIAVSGGSVHQHNDGLSLTGAVQSGNTYTWTLDVDQYYDYTFTENNYTFSENLYTYNALYRVRNSNTSDQNTGGWKSYGGGTVTVTGQGYNEGDSDRLTVSFLNTYTAPGTVILRKVDAVTGNLMPGVSFTIGKADGSAFTMKRTGIGHYTADPASDGTSTNTITTDSTGQAYLYIGGGDYTLVEQVPTGYDDPGTITVVLQGNSNNDYKVVAITSAGSASDAHHYVERDSDNLTLTVKNYSRTINLRVTKNWLDDENKPVTIQLYRNGNPMGSSYTVTFDGTVDSDESPAWTHTFTGLPLYADGGLAQYTLREEALGDFKYAEGYTDGYQYYDVTYSPMSYLDASGSVTTDMGTVDTIALQVSNKRSSGAMSINKVDGSGNPVAGAEFYLYAAPNADQQDPALVNGAWNVLSGLTRSKIATSDAKGVVSFGNMPAGRYYIIEHSAPSGYEPINNLYSMQFDGTTGKLLVWTGDAWAEVSGNSVVNTRSTANVTITKQVTGNMGDLSKTFDFTVTSTEPIGQPLGTEYDLSGDGKTATFSLGHEGSVTLQNVPIGAVLTISEGNAQGYEMTVTANGGSAPLTSYTVVSGDNAITVRNNKSATPDTGVILDSLPYIVILACVALVVILLLVRRRRDRDDR